MTGRHRGVTLKRTIADLNLLFRGWAGTFGFSQWRELENLDGWIRRRLRCMAWAKHCEMSNAEGQWKTRLRFRDLPL
jgi:hypothetical protein